MASEFVDDVEESGELEVRRVGPGDEIGTTCVAMEVTDGVLTEETLAVDDADVTVTLLPKN